MKAFILILISLSAQFAFSQAVVVEIGLSPVGDFKATTDSIQGSVQDRGSEYYAENIVVDLKSLKTGVALRDEHTQKHLKTTDFPQAVLLKAKGKGGKGIAKIKIKGIEKTVRGTYVIEGDGKVMNASFPLKLSEFAISDISYMGVGVEDEITVTVRVPIKTASK